MSSHANRRDALKALRTALATTLAAGALSACSGGIFGMFDSSKNKKKLPGTRISVLALERELRPNIEAADTQIVLPRPLDTDAWPEAGGFSHHAMHHVVINANPKLAWRQNIGASSGK